MNILLLILAFIINFVVFAFSLLLNPYRFGWADDPQLATQIDVERAYDANAFAISSLVISVSAILYVLMAMRGHRRILFGGLFFCVFAASLARVVLLTLAIRADGLN